MLIHQDLTWTVKGGSAVEVSDKHVFFIVNVSANVDSEFNMNRHLLMNNYDSSGGRHIGVNNDISAVNDVTGDYINLNFYM